MILSDAYTARAFLLAQNLNRLQVLMALDEFQVNASHRHGHRDGRKPGLAFQPPVLDADDPMAAQSSNRARSSSNNLRLTPKRIQQIRQQGSRTVFSMQSKLEQSEFDKEDLRQPPQTDRAFVDWNQRIDSLPGQKVQIRTAIGTPTEARRLTEIQHVCHYVPIRSVWKNATEIHDHHVLIAELDGIHIGYCITSKGTSDSDTLFIREIAVAPPQQRRGAAFKLLSRAIADAPDADIAVAIHQSNTAALSLVKNLAEEIHATVKKVNLGTYPNKDLGIRRGDGYRSWVMRRSIAK